MDRISIWNYLQKKITLNQLPNLKQKTILDFGAGECLLPSMLDFSNNFICIDPNFSQYENIVTQKNIFKINGSFEKLKCFKNDSFDVIFCHNVFEYLDEETRKKVILEFIRILKNDGFISFMKHNKFGRILEQIVFKNDFDNYKKIFIENESYSERFGNIQYFKDKDLIKWSNNKLTMVNKFGLRMFYDLQSDSSLWTDKEWQEKIIESEMYFSKTEEFINVSFLHHLILIKK